MKRRISTFFSLAALSGALLWSCAKANDGGSVDATSTGAGSSAGGAGGAGGKSNASSNASGLPSTSSSSTSTASSSSVASSSATGGCDPVACAAQCQPQPGFCSGGNQCVCQLGTAVSSSSGTASVGTGGMCSIDFNCFFVCGFMGGDPTCAKCVNGTCDCPMVCGVDAGGPDSGGPDGGGTGGAGGMGGTGTGTGGAGGSPAMDGGSPNLDGGDGG